MTARSRCSVQGRHKSVSPPRGEGGATLSQGSGSECTALRYVPMCHDHTFSLLPLCHSSLIAMASTLPCIRVGEVEGIASNCWGGKVRILRKHRRRTRTADKSPEWESINFHLLHYHRARISMCVPHTKLAKALLSWVRGWEKATER